MICRGELHDGDDSISKKKDDKQNQQTPAFFLLFGKPVQQNSMQFLKPSAPKFLIVKLIIVVKGF